MSLLGGLAAAWGRGASAQGNKPTRIGLLPFGSPSNDHDKSLVEAFRLGLRQAGLTEGVMPTPTKQSRISSAAALHCWYPPAQPRR